MLRRILPFRMMPFRMMPFRMMPEVVDSADRLNRNKPDAARLRAADRITGSGIGAGTVLLSQMMKHPEG